MSPLDGVNGARRNLLARIGLSVVCRVSAREDAAIAPRSPFQPITRLWQFDQGLPCVAREYGHTWCVASIRRCATSGAMPGRLTFRRTATS